MKRLAAIAVVCLGVVLASFGLLFLVGSAGQMRRLIISAAISVVGAILIGLGVRWVRRARQDSPETIRAEILAFARRKNGEVTDLDLEALLGERWIAHHPVLQALKTEGACREHVRGNTIHYVFADLQPRLAVRKCEFCNAEIPLDNDLISCPQCGGSIKTGVQRMSVADEQFYDLGE